MLKWTLIKSLLIASLISPLLVLGNSAEAKDLPEPEWVYNIDKGEWSLPWNIVPGVVVDSQGNQSLLGNKVVGNQSYLENIDPLSGKLRWSKLENFDYVPSEDGYIFMFDKNNKVSAMNLATGKIIWTGTLPFDKKVQYYSYSSDIYAGKNGSLYVASHSKDYKATLYHYDSNGRKTKKYTLPYSIVGIEGDYVFAKTYSDDPNTYILNLATGKKIVTAKNGISYIPVNVLKDGTIVTQNVVKNAVTLKAYNAKGQLKWTKKLPYVSERTETYTLQNRLLFMDGKNNSLKLYASDGKLLASKSYKPLATGYNRIRRMIEVSRDQQSLMLTVKKGDRYEINILDSTNLNVIKAFSETERDFYSNANYELLNNRTHFIVVDYTGKSIVNYDLTRIDY
ncbi:PQQ-like beta-propeller repeat protein [Paenibacillus xylanexedens]|uniref:PQQ-like beta-propeller repeat protein n=1 Tax=Paenibacillus xylanexedens TaxID=528191 RepID=UPI0011A7A4C3|nr:PQQ-like beta-propeller repeat protein [Paenibacillus xylanexedens]